MQRFLRLALLVLFASSLIAQTPSSRGGGIDPEKDPSGMYSFLKEGEYVQLTLEDGELSGFISRFGDSDTDIQELVAALTDVWTRLTLRPAA